MKRLTRKIFYTLCLCLCLTVFANAQFGGKLKEIGKKVKGETSKPAETAPKNKQTNMPANRPAEKPKYNDEVRIQEYAAVTIGGKSAMKNIGDCLTASGSLSNNVLELQFSEIKCQGKGEVPFDMTLAVNGVSGKGVYYVPRKDSVYAGKMSVKPNGTKYETYATDGNKQATVAVTLTAVTNSYVEGSLTGSLMSPDGRTKAPVTAKFKVEINENDRTAPSNFQSESDRKAEAVRGGGANENGEYLSFTMDGGAIGFDSNCAYYNGVLDNGAVTLSVNEDQCPDITNREPQKFYLTIQNYKGKGVYKVSSARAYRSGDMSFIVGKTSNNEQFMTEVDLGGLATVTVTNATSEYFEGTFTANLVNVQSKKKATFTGKFRANLHER